MEHFTSKKPTQFLNPTKSSNAKIVFSKIPHFEFQTQRFVLPGISVNTVNIQTPFGNYTRPGDVLQFQKPWTLEIVLDEMYISFSEIFNWINLYAATDDEVERDFKNLVTDAKIVVLDNEAKEIATVTFNDVYPFSMGQIGYNTTDTSYEYMKFNVDFDYSKYTIDTYGVL